jgi:hypothetical protein
MGTDSSRGAPLRGRVDATTAVGLAVVLALAAWATHLQLTRTQLLVEPRVRIERYLEGSAARPFCFRVLVPWSVGALAHAIPGSVPDAICGGASHPRECEIIPEGSEQQRPYVALGLILFASIASYAVIMGRTFRRVFQSSEGASWLAAAGSLLTIAFVVFFGGQGHIYDFTQLAFFAGMLSTLLTEQLAVFLLLFVLSCWTKETAIFMTFAYCAIYYDRLPRKRFVSYLLLQIVAFVGVYGAVRFLYRHNPGGPMEIWYRQQMAWFLRKPLQRMVLVAAGSSAILFAWAEKPLSLRRALWMLPPHLAMFLVAAQPAEIRNLYESLPVVMLFMLRNAEVVARRLLPAPLRSSSPQ